MTERIQFQIKLTPEINDKMRQESKKLGITMSSFISMLITQYDGITIKKC